MKWGILATGNIATKFAGTLLQMEDQEAVACASRNLQKAEAFAENYGIKRAYGSYEELVLDKEVEAVYIATPNNLHYENCRMCLEAGKHVLCEKPFTVNAGEARALLDLAEKRGLFIMEAFWVRFLPAVKKLQKIIASGEIGDVVWMRCEYGFAVSGARKDRKFDSALAGGALLDIGIYNLGFVRMIMGNEQPVAVSSKAHMNEYGTDDLSTVVLTYSGGRMAVATTAMGLPMGRNAVIWGTKGCIQIEDHQHLQRFVVKPEGKEAYQVEMPFMINGFEYQILETAGSIAKGLVYSEAYGKKDMLESMELLDEIRKDWNLKFACEQADYK